MSDALLNAGRQTLMLELQGSQPSAGASGRHDLSAPPISLFTVKAK